MARNVGYIEAIYDAWALGLIIKEFMKSLINPMYFAKIVYKGMHAIYASTERSPRNTIFAILPKTNI